MNRNLTLIKILTLITVALTIGIKLVSAADQKCPTIRLANGRSKFQKGGRLVRFRCLKGYEFVGRRYMNCFRGQWDFQREQGTNMPMCVKPGCRASSKVNGHFLETYKGAVVNVVCNLGYTLTGASPVYCNGTDWNLPFPECKAINPTPPKSCDFENSLCGWTQDPIGDWLWKKEIDFWYSLFPGSEISDMRYQNGNFGRHMLLGNSSSRIANATERLFSPVFPPKYSKDSCFTFWYLLHGKTAGYLKVFVKEEGAEFYNTIPRFWVNGDQSPNWRFGYFALYEKEVPFQIIFEGMSLPGNESETAFDDVNIQSGSDCDHAKRFFDTFQPPTSTSTEASIDDEDSCRNRCGVEPRDKQNKCSCHSSCTTLQTCCSDYEAVCTSGTEAASSSTVEDVASTPEATPTTTEEDGTRKHKIVGGVQYNEDSQRNDTFPSETVGSDRRTVPPPQRNTTVAVKIPTRLTQIVPKTHTSTVTASKTTVTTTSAATTKTNRVTTPTTTTTTTTTSTTTTSTTTTTKPTSRRFNHNYLAVDPSLAVRMNRILHDVRVSGDVHETGDNSPQLMKSESDQASDGVLFGAVEAVIIVIAVLICTAIVVAFIRRRRRQRTKTESMVEDSDVRFLTADEFLDFTLARPADDDL
ncbi:UNVERIFIED_CONTAM: hypothetical protein PYX00_003743 [Menopon gallinae]|uniref:Uncharacterized protein n=1 Tax=Menopon gallinae TaxID=328185 RepID=A0AAW2I2S4_9NEOP